MKISVLAAFAVSRGSALAIAKGPRERAGQAPDTAEERERGRGGPGIHEQAYGLDGLAEDRKCPRVGEKDTGRLLIEGVPVRHLAGQQALRDVGVLALVALEGNGDEGSPHEDECDGSHRENRGAAPARAGDRGSRRGIHIGRHGPRSSIAGNASLFVPRWRKRETCRLRGA